MDLFEVIQGRKSIRAFKPHSVPKERIEEILGLAIHAPSAINLQPGNSSSSSEKRKRD